MSQTEMKLTELAEEQSGVVQRVELSGIMRRRLQDLGMIPGTRVVVTKKSPGHGPTAYKIRETVYALRETDASHIIITKE